MPYIRRNQVGNIIALDYELDSKTSSEAIESGGWEWLEDNDTELSEFVSLLQKQNPLGSSDLDFVRVVEDLVELLVEKNYIHFTDLPEAAQRKFRNRKSIRGKLNPKLDLLDDEDGEGFI